MKCLLPIKLCLLTLITIYQPLIIASPLTIMTYNIRRLGDDPVEHQWENRRQLVFDQILNENPAVIGFQEVVVGQQLEDLKKGLSHYIAVGETGRKAFATGWFQKRVVSLEKAKNESNPLLYDPEQVSLISYETFGINPTGRFLNASLPRICTQATFVDKQNNKQFIVYNTHLSSSGAWGLKDGTELIRTKQIKMIIKNIKKNQPCTTPVIIMGDLNTRLEGNMKKKFTKANFINAKEKALVQKGPEATRTGWNDEQLKVIDHILIKGNVKILEHTVLESPVGHYPSDHRPVCVTINI